MLGFVNKGNTEIPHFLGSNLHLLLGEEKGQDRKDEPSFWEAAISVFQLEIALFGKKISHQIENHL